MREIEIYTHYLLRFTDLFKKNAGFGIFTLLSGFAISLSGMQKALIFLAIVFIMDFATGLYASWIEHKKTPKEENGYFFKSNKVRLSVVKAVSYCMFILCTWFMNVLFFDAPIPLFGSTRSFTICELATGFCIAIEMWSIIENMKRSGFDIIGKGKELIKEAWDFRNSLKNE